jgi:rhodanese-related sulfurtransferase
MERSIIMARTITREELKAKMDRGDNFVLVEALPEESYRRSHLPGARLMPMEQVKDLAGHIIPDKGAEVVVYCMNRT